MDLLKSLIVVSEKAANVARLCRQNQHLFQLLIQKKCCDEANPRFVEDFKTLADVLIQELVKWETGNKFPELRQSIYGEENNIFSNKLGETIQVEIKESQGETASLLKTVLYGDEEAAKLLAHEVHKEVFLEEIALGKTLTGEFQVDLTKVGVWIDPIDSTAEYINGSQETSVNGITINGLKCVTVLIGVYDKESGLPLAGVINQPFIRKKGNLWEGRCIWGAPSNPGLNIPNLTTRTICVSSSEDEAVTVKLKQKGYHVTEASGAGYKILTVITGLADAYVLTKDSTYKWDTCGPQAILRAFGGDIVIYNEAIKKHPVSVKYGKQSCNLGGIIAYREATVLNDILAILT